MKNKFLKELFTITAMIVATLSLTATAGTVTVIPENSTFYIGGSAADPYNNGGFIVFQPGSTLVVTQRNSALNVWSTLVATNGAATIEFCGTSGSIQSHAFACGDGSLLVKGAKRVGIGHSTEHPVYDISNLTFEDNSGDGIVLGKYCTMLSFPERWSVGDGERIWLCGSSDMFPNDEVVNLTKGNFVLANNTAIPMSKPIHVTYPANLMVIPRSIVGTDDIVSNFPESIPFRYLDSGVFTNRNAVTLSPVRDDLPQLVFSSFVDVVYAGSLSGTGVVSAVGGSASYSAAKRNTVELAGDNSGFSGVIDVPKAFTDLTFGQANADGNAIISVSAANCTLIGVSGLNATVETADPDCGLVLAGDGRFSLLSGSFTNSVAYWFDFSRTDTHRYPGEGTTTAYASQTLNSHPYIERVVDWRKPDAPYSFWNRRMYKADGSLDFQASVYGCRMDDAGAAGNMSYLSLPFGSRRLPFSNGEGYNTRASIAAQTVVMVFGSQNGGGNAVVGTENGAFGRAGTDVSSGVTINTSHSVWVDGVQVDPTAANTLNGAWQVISINIDGEPFNGLGWNSYLNDSNYGGQNYGEVLIFTKAISERQRIEAETYLADKWGLSAQYSDEARARLAVLDASVTNCVTIKGGVVLKTNDDATRLDDCCSGTIELTGGALTFGRRPYAEKEIPSDGRLFWLDADDEGSLVRLKDLGQTTRGNQVRAVRNKTSSGFVAGEPVAYGTGNRAPTWVKLARGTCPERGWIDFNEWYGSDGSGNCMRFFNYVEGLINNSDLGTLSAMNTRVAFVVQDSSHGGGLPLAQSISVPAAQWRDTRNPSAPIWRNSSPAAFANGENRINGAVIDQTKGFSGGPEVFTVRASEQVNVPFVDCYNHTEGKTYEEGAGDIIGEMLYYSANLSDGVVEGIEAYLMKKWLARLPKGFCDASDVAVAGYGSVLLDDPAARPKLSAAFSGTLSVAGSGVFEMTIDTSTGEVRGAIVAPDATFSLPEPCTLAVDFTAKPGKVDGKVAYTLVECADLSGVSWTFVRGSNVPGAGRAKFVQTGGKVELVLSAVGTIVVVR